MLMHLRFIGIDNYAKRKNALFSPNNFHVNVLRKKAHTQKFFSLFLRYITLNFYSR